MATGTWSEDWLKWRDGTDCPFCKEGRPETLDFGMRYFSEDAVDADRWQNSQSAGPDGVRFFSNEVVDAYLLNGENAFGSSLIVWRAGHLVDIVDMTSSQLYEYALAVQQISKALSARYLPLKLTYFTIGSHVPHLHTVVVLRYLDDAAPNAILLWPRGSAPHTNERMSQERSALSSLVSSIVEPTAMEHEGGVDS